MEVYKEEVKMVQMTAARALASAVVDYVPRGKTQYVRERRYLLARCMCNRRMHGRKSTYFQMAMVGLRIGRYLKAKEA
jgi:hypothetical protein